MPFIHRFVAPALALAVAGCAGISLPNVAGTTNAPARAAGNVSSQGYTIRSFSYHIMPLRTRTHPAGKIVYPDDLTYYGGPMMKTEAAHDIFVDCSSKNQRCWGAPVAFQRRLTGSAFAALLHQYTKSGAQSLTFADATPIAYPVHHGTALYENDLFQIVHTVAKRLHKSGYADLYHVFLPKGVDTCFDFTTACYSPNRPRKWDFCAYHGTVRFSDIGTVVYSIEPYQDVPGCLTPKSPGASEETNSTISTLAHETFESITDPGPPLAWYNYQGGELADECEYFVSNVTLGGVAYKTQPMYSNKYHACATGP